MSALESDNRPRVIALVGPTASGKTGLGLELAREFGTEIISVDSMAVYRGMDIGTAKPALAERQGIIHHLIDVVEPDQAFSAADFVAAARPIIDRLHASGRPTVLVGGTGLYLRTLLHGLFDGPPADAEFRAAVQQEAARDAESGDPDSLHRRLQAVDPLAATRLHPRDHFRIIRALEVHHATGRPLSAWQAEHAFAESAFRWIKLAIELPREELYRRIDARVLDMVARGLEQETAGLLERYGAEIKPMKGLGYAHFTKRLQGELLEAEAVELMQRDTRRFSRRQITWFRGESGVQWLSPEWARVREIALKFVET